MNKVIEASNFILDQTNFNGKTGFILGSGLGGFTDVLTKKRILKYSKIPNYSQTSVEGHKGELIIGKLDQKDILVANGRLHLYEGHSIEDIVFPIRVFKECGIKNLIITNSAGSLKKENPPGTIMIIDGHINCTFQDNLDDPKIIKDRKFHSSELFTIAKQIAFENDIPIASGNYCWTLGPTYETSSEIQYFTSLKGSSVGMSTLPEIQEGGNLGLKLLTLSLLTNYAAGISEKSLTHEEVLENAKKSTNKMITLLSGIVKKVKT
tara:strand:+ start:934 stop:1728 length:795 start_codon:yes stop_codon:yes gene_type:complete